MYRKYGKRLLDLVFSLAALVLLLPVIGLLAILVRLKLGSPIIFSQERPGLGARPFTLLKFRTMTDERDERGQLLPDGARLTRLGRFLRRASLDELPELLNVVKGEMSLVGPRPLLTKYLAYYREDEQLRHTVRPGITGWAQIKGRNSLSWNERLALDVWYVNNCSFSLDARIILMTFGTIFRRDGIIVDPRSVMLDLDQERSESSVK